VRRLPAFSPGRTCHHFIGAEAFKEWVRRTFYAQERHGEVPESRLMAPSADEIMQVVCRAYGVDNAVLRAMRRGKGK